MYTLPVINTQYYIYPEKNKVRAVRFRKENCSWSTILYFLPETVFPLLSHASVVIMQENAEWAFKTNSNFFLIKYCHSFALFMYIW